MSIKNRYISVKSPFESELVQSLLFEAGAGWQLIGKKTLLLNSCIIVINDRLEMYTMAVNPHSRYKKLNLPELVNIVQPDTSEVDNSYYVCKFSDNHIRFEGSEVDLTIDEMSELLQVIRSLSHRDFEITTSDDTDDQVVSLTNLTIHFKWVFMRHSIFFKSKEEADAVNSTLNNGVVVHMAYLRLLHSIDSTPEDIFNTDTLPLIWDSTTPGWILDSKTSGRGIINNRTVKFSLFQQPLSEGELGGWTIIFVGTKRT